MSLMSLNCTSELLLSHLHHTELWINLGTLIKNIEIALIYKCFLLNIYLTCEHTYVSNYVHVLFYI